MGLEQNGGLRLSLFLPFNIYLFESQRYWRKGGRVRFSIYRFIAQMAVLAGAGLA